MLNKWGFADEFKINMIKDNMKAAMQLGK